MGKLLGYKRSSLEEFYKWQGENACQDINTVNGLGGFYRYTDPIIHKNSNGIFNEDGDLIEVIGDVKDVLCVIEHDCPEELIPHDLLTKEEVEALGWIGFSGKEI